MQHGQSAVQLECIVASDYLVELSYRYAYVSWNIFCHRFISKSILRKRWMVVSRKYTFARHVAFLYVALLVLMLKGCSRDESNSFKQKSRDSANTNFSSEIVLASYANNEVDGHTFLTLMWHTPYDKPRDAYSVIIHAIDKQGKVLFQFDHKLVNAAGLSTNLWNRELVKDVFQLTPPVGYAPGKYTLRIGVWAPENKRWLEVFATNLVQDNDEFFRYKAVLLPDIECR